MSSKNKMLLGSLLTFLSLFCIIFSSTLGFTSLERPWSFIAGFLNGVAAGLGATLVIFGLVQNKQK